MSNRDEKFRGFETVIVDTISELVNWELMLHRKANDKKLGYDPRQSYGDVQIVSTHSHASR